MLLDYKPPMTPLDIIYSDKDIVVLHKPSGLLSVPGRQDHMKDSLSQRVQNEFKTATVVHRLDMDTSGVMIMALNIEAHRYISKQFEKRATEKSYVAHLYGVMEQDEGEIDLPLILDWPNRPRHIVDHENGKPSLTRWKVLDRAKDYTRIGFYPVTGRTHQLRVHAQAINHPILGDTLYAHDTARGMADRLMLHAEKLTLTHPYTKEIMHFTSDPEF
ncbi:MAG: bifunctional tRNA pseudouridine(32) synthase/ribosomal large subunit pseudouridine synthase RluA [Emcibacter sp.]|nr:bifunctional tRNA pseudouridine(32) synthase/ribosomal large subunit pseudouridine synthase RluA [Emcibacter sp.]